MKKIILSLVFVFALVFAAQAETNAEIIKVKFSDTEFNKLGTNYDQNSETNTIVSFNENTISIFILADCLDTSWEQAEAIESITGGGIDAVRAYFRVLVKICFQNEK